MSSPSSTPATAPIRAALRADQPDLPGLTARDAERVAAAIEADLAASTRTTYASSWRQWEAWCDGRGVAALPAAPELIAAFLAERAEAGLTFGTIDAACSAIAHRHRQDGLAHPTVDITVRRVRRGLRRILGTAPVRQTHPLTPAEVGQIVASLYLNSACGRRDRALILIGYAAALRPSERGRRHRDPDRGSPGHHPSLEDRPGRRRPAGRRRPRTPPAHRPRRGACGLARGPTRGARPTVHPHSARHRHPRADRGPDRQPDGARPRRRGRLE